MGHRQRVTCVNDPVEVFSSLLSAKAPGVFCTVWWVLKTLLVTLIFFNSDQ